MKAGAKQSFIVRKPITRGGRVLYPGTLLTASALGAHVQRWLNEGRIKPATAASGKAVRK